MKKPPIDELKTNFSHNLERGSARCSITASKSRLIYEIILNTLRDNEPTLTAYTNYNDSLVKLYEPILGGTETYVFEYTSKEFRDWLIKVVTEAINKKLNKEGEL